MSRGIVLLIGLLAAVLIPALLGGGEIGARLQNFPLHWLLIMFGMILFCWVSTPCACACCWAISAIGSRR